MILVLQMEICGHRTEKVPGTEGKMCTQDDLLIRRQKYVMKHHMKSLKEKWM